MDGLAKLLRRTPLRTFIFYPLLAVAWELLIHRRLKVQPIFLLLMVWGYLQYRLCGLYRLKRGGGGPGVETPPKRLLLSGPYAYSRNPMYLGHIIFLAGLALTLQSIFAAAITVATAIWFHLRVRHDEARLLELWGEPYRRYLLITKRWLPGLF
ncbi:MAG TPA: methyltransferase [Candidatus Binatia bacterium]|jgi:protein-S-isoprenylcysteine O-methyltransferase Ste14